MPLLCVNSIGYHISSPKVEKKKKKKIRISVSKIWFMFARTNNLDNHFVQNVTKNN